jgi:hypothetical protein
MSSGMPITYPTAETMRALLAQLPAGWLGELGERLRTDANGELRSRYLGSFDGAADKARTRLSRPLPQDDFAATKATIDACSVAREVVDLAWSALNTTPGALRSGP